MRKIEMAVYGIEELDEKAQKKAHTDYMDSGICDIPNDDITEVYNKLDELMNLVNSDVENLRGVRLATWIYNNWYDKICKPKWLGFSYSNCKPVYSNCQVDTDCNLTGTCYDMAVVEPILQFLSSPTEIDIQMLARRCRQNLERMAEDDAWEKTTFDYFKELSDASGWEYTENGKLI